MRTRDKEDNRAKCPLPNPAHDDPTDTYEVVEFNAVAGTTYRIQVTLNSYGKMGILLRPPEVYDVALSQSVSRRARTVAPHAMRTKNTARSTGLPSEYPSTPAGDPRLNHDDTYREPARNIHANGTHEIFSASGWRSSRSNR